MRRHSVLALRSPHTHLTPIAAITYPSLPSESHPSHSSESYLHLPAPDTPRPPCSPSQCSPVHPSPALRPGPPKPAHAPAPATPPPFPGPGGSRGGGVEVGEEGHGRVHLPLAVCARRATALNEKLRIPRRVILRGRVRPPGQRPALTMARCALHTSYGVGARRTRLPEPASLHDPPPPASLQGQAAAQAGDDVGEGALERLMGTN
jgi:hypothetical protein